MRRGRQRNRIAAWLGLVALAVQALIPLLLAGEIKLAQSGEYAAVFDPCPYDQDSGGASGHADHHGRPCGLCPICLALLASPAFTQPATVPLPLPAAQPVAVAQPETHPAVRAASRIAYRSRAPPIV